MSIAEIVAISAEIITLVGVVIPVFRTIKKYTETIKKIANGTKCQLRTDMLNTYYTNKKDKKLREFERENFEKLYSAYDALDGNSFIDDVYSEIKTWEVER